MVPPPTMTREQVSRILANIIARIENDDEHMLQAYDVSDELLSIEQYVLTHTHNSEVRASWDAFSDAMYDAKGNMEDVLEEMLNLQNTLM